MEKNPLSSSNIILGNLFDNVTLPSRKVWYYTACTLNGYIADENDSLDWLFECTQPVSNPISFQSAIGVIVCGSHTLEWIINKYDVIANPQQWKTFFADIPLVVFSSRKLTLPQGANITILNSSVQIALPFLYNLAEHKDIWILGGGELAGQFFEVKALTHMGITYISTSTKGGVNVLPHKISLENLRLTNCESNTESWFCEFTVTYPGLS